MIRKTILFLLVITGFSFPQEKYLIYFKDKDIKPTQYLSKTSNVYQKTLKYLTEKCLRRRIHVMPEDSVITYEDLPIRDDYKKALTDKGITIQKELKWFNAVSAVLNNEQLKIAESFNFVDRIEKVKPIRLKEKPQFTDMTPAATLGKSSSDSADYGYSYRQLEFSGIPLVHSRGIRGEGVLIGLLDSGFDWKEHKALKNADVKKEYDFVYDDSITANQAEDAAGQDAHGTFVLSIIGGNDPGNYLGAAYKSSFLLAKTEDERIESRIEEDNFASALEWVENMGVDVVSSSIGYNEFDNSQTSYNYKDFNGKTTISVKAAEKAFQRGVVVISSAGNEGSKSWHYILTPSDGANVIAVGAVNSSNNVASFSGRGPTSDGRIKPDIVALGTGVYGAQARSKIEYGSGDGTSYSTPLAGSTAALLLSAYPHLKNYQVRNILLESSDNSAAPNNDRGYGLISAVRAIEFPNIEYNGNGYIIHKAFLSSGNIQTNSVKLYYKSGQENYNSMDMKLVKDAFYQAELPAQVTGNEIKFYFEYKNAEGNTVRDSFEKNYALVYGSLNVFQNIKPSPEASTPDNYVLSQNYPNPFNNLTRIDYIANAGERAELIIMNAIGQTVKYFSRLSNSGTNSIIWNGMKEDGTACASGVYYYILRLSGKDYGKKMVLLK